MTKKTYGEIGTTERGSAINTAMKEADFFFKRSSFEWASAFADALMNQSLASSALDRLSAEQEREAFEVKFDIAPEQRHASGEYIHPSIQSLWRGWQARAALNVPASQSAENRGASGDACEECNGTKGGTPGNENIIDGRVLCDYCHGDLKRRPSICFFCGEPMDGPHEADCPQSAPPSQAENRGEGAIRDEWFARYGVWGTTFDDWAEFVRWYNYAPQELIDYLKAIKRSVKEGS